MEVEISVLADDNNQYSTRLEMIQTTLVLEESMGNTSKNNLSFDKFRIRHIVHVAVLSKVNCKLHT